MSSIVTVKTLGLVEVMFDDVELLNGRAFESSDDIVCVTMLLVSG